MESVLRERTTALEMSNIDRAKAFFNDAPLKLLDSSGDVKL